MEESSSRPRGSVIVARSVPTRNADRLTFTSFQHAQSSPCQAPGQDWSALKNIEQRLAQPSLNYRSYASPEHRERGLQALQARYQEEAEGQNLKLDQIYSQFSDLVKSSLIKDGANLEEDEEEEKQSEADKRPVSDCHVCGDKAIAHLHYGGICCYSCKAFFRRAVQNGKDASYRCKVSSDCEVSRLTRRGCQKCRFEKCLRVGMTASWVLSEEQCQIRFGKGKTRRRVRRESCEESQEQPDRPGAFSLEDQTFVESLLAAYEASKEKISFSDANESMLRGISRMRGAYSASEMNDMVNTVIKRNIFFMENVQHFSLLSHSDKKALLTKNMTEMCHIRGAIKFNPLTASFDVEQRGERGSPDIGITQESIKNLYSSVSTARYPALAIMALAGRAKSCHCRDIVKLMAKLSSLQLPHEVMILLIPVVSLSADGLTLERKTFVENSQVEYLNLIYRYS